MPLGIPDDELPIQQREAKAQDAERNPVGRPRAGKVKLTCQVLPETRKVLGDKPGARIDELIRKEKEK